MALKGQGLGLYRAPETLESSMPANAPCTLNYVRRHMGRAAQVGYVKLLIYNLNPIINYIDPTPPPLYRSAYLLNPPYRSHIMEMLKV